MILETERMYLRELCQGDFDALCAMLKDPEVMYAYEGAFSDEESHAWLEKEAMNRRETKREVAEAVIRKYN